jgi:hypothetical protein
MTSSRDPAVAAARFSWDEGLRRLSQPAPPAVARARRRIVAAVDDELRRRVGLTFTLADLARAYDGASSWYLDLAARVAPREPASWDPAVALDAAFAAYSRQAVDARL